MLCALSSLYNDAITLINTFKFAVWLRIEDRYIRLKARENSRMKVNTRGCYGVVTCMSQGRLSMTTTVSFCNLFHWILNVRKR